jgi:hypothetical protein
MRKTPYALEMSRDPQFVAVVARLVRKAGVESIVETGTHLGTGSTLVLAATLLPVSTIECNRECVESARRNLAAFPNVRVYHGHSCAYRRMVDFINADTFYEEAKHLDIAVDVDDGNPKAFYAGEIAGADLEDGLLARLADNPRRQILLLDSAGGVGLVELSEVLSFRHLNRKILILDDIRHVKHFRSVMVLRELGGKVRTSRSGRWAWCRCNGLDPGRVARAVADDALLKRRTWITGAS